MTTVKLALYTALIVLSISFAKAQNSKDGVEISTTVQQQNNSISSKYLAFQNEEQRLITEINSLNQLISVSSKSKAKRYTKDVIDLQEQLAVVRRIMATFPQEVRDPEASALQAEIEKQEFMDEIERLGVDRAVKGQGGSDYFTLSTTQDEPKRTETAETPQRTVTESQPVYQIVLAVSRKDQSSMTHITGLDDIMYTSEQNDTIIYYQGSYDDRAQAQLALDQIKASGNFLYAFITKV